MRKSFVSGKGLLRMRYPTTIRVMQRWGVAERRIAWRRETAHGRSSRVGRSLFERRARQIVVQTHHFRCWVAGGRCSRIGAAGDHRGRGDGNARVGHGERGRAAHFLLLGVVQDWVGCHGCRVDRRCRMRRSVGSGPRVSELRRVVVWHIMLVNIVKAHTAVLAVLVFNNHSHGG